MEQNHFFTVSANDAAKQFDSDISVGLSASAAEQRLQSEGKNELKEAKKVPLIIHFLKQFANTMIIVLLVAAAISAFFAIYEGHYADLFESGVILLIVIVNAIIGLVQEERAEAALEALKNLNSPYCKVRRGGELVKIKSSELVRGDIVLLEAGDIIPADIRLFESHNLKIEEAALTGESVPVEKNANFIAGEKTPLGDRKNMAYSGGIVTYGRGGGIVVATGMHTEVGRIAAMLDVKNEETPLQKQLEGTAKTLSIVVLAIAAVIFVFSVIRKAPIMYAFMTSVAIAVAAIPEGLPAVVTIVLALGVRKMSERNAIVRNLPAVETLGCCQVVCSDKTGTLTLNKMTVKSLFTIGDGEYDETVKPTLKDQIELVRTLVLCNDTVANGKALIGDPTETALIEYARRHNLYESLLCLRVDEKPFDSERKMMTTVNQGTDGKTAHIKGASDLLIAKCKYILDGDTCREITDADKLKISAVNGAMAAKALRVLGVAMKKENISNMDTIEEDMIFVGLVGMIDPPRSEVKDAVAVCRRAGIHVVMVTGDHIETARAIAKDIGILKENGIVISGAELDKLSDEEFIKDINRYCVFARVSPQNKVRIVKAFKARGLIVAMTGDGVNDAPSIKTADIGIGMGITGTDVSKGASDIVLADDNFATIVSAVEEGRKIYSNIKKAVQFLLSANIAEVLSLFVVTVIFDMSFLTPLMILWVNLVTDSLPALALGVEKSEHGVMEQQPRGLGKNLLSGKTGLHIIVQGAIQTCIVLGAYFIGEFVMSPDPNIGVSMAFITLCIMQLFHAYNLKSADQSLFSSNPLDNRYLNLAFIVGTALTAVVLFVPFMHDLFNIPALLTEHILVSVAFAAAVIPLVEIQKLIFNAIFKSKKE